MNYVRPGEEDASSITGHFADGTRRREVFTGIALGQATKARNKILQKMAGPAE
jgi:hypothetical protein